MQLEFADADTGRHLLISVIPMAEHRFSAVSTDITPLHELQEQQQMLLHMISHDLRTPLTIIDGHMQLLKDEISKAGVDGEVQQSMDTIRQSVQRMNLMIQDLVDAARAEGGQLKLKLQPINLLAYLDDILKRSAAVLDITRIRLEVPDDLPAVHADYNRLERIITNLLSNALKYSRAGTPVRVNARRKEEMVEVSVTDLERASLRRISSISLIASIVLVPKRKRKASVWASISRACWWMPTAGVSGWRAKWGRGAPSRSRYRSVPKRNEDTPRSVQEAGACPAKFHMAGRLLIYPECIMNINDELSAEAVDARIREYRTAPVTLTVRDAAGRPLANAEVTVEQTRHRFLFGCNGFHLVDQDAAYRERYREAFAALLNFATLPFYWGGYEPAPGETNRERLTAMANWCREQGIRAKGHPLCWHEVPPAWLGGLPVEEIHRLQLARITREVSGFAGLIDTWDVVNEVMATPAYHPENPITRLCNATSLEALVRDTFTTARRANPHATLVLNDFDTAPACAEQEQRLLDADIPIDVIGVQSHMHVGYWGAEKSWEVCRRFTALDKPVHFTELTILSGKLKSPDDRDWHFKHTDWPSTPEGEARQETEVREFYRLLFSCPGIEAITWWDFVDGDWQGAPAGLLRQDLTPKPAYDALLSLIKGDWWTGPLTLRTDADGQAAFRGFLGDYRVVAGDRCGTFALAQAKETKVNVNLSRE